MNYLFPQIEHENMKRLIIIGNGFDLASGIKSSYSDFKQWLQENGKHQFIFLMDTFFSNQRDVWGDIEKALGEYDENSIVDYCKPDEEFDYDHQGRSVAAIEDGPDWIFHPTLDEFREAFTNWVDSIDITMAKRLRDLPIEGKYLTFNYTETLEKIYGIPESNILHIHGSRIFHDEYIFGHNNYRDPNEAYNDESEMFFLKDTWSKIIEWMNNMVKDSGSIIHSNSSFFTDLSDIDQIAVYGHSFCEVDWPYLEEIVRNVGIDTPWHISYHLKEDADRINDFVTKNSLKNVTLSYW